MAGCAQFYILLFCTGVATAVSEKRHALKLLQDRIFQNVNRNLPPYSGNNTFINVTMDYAPLAILDLDSANEILSVSSVCQLSWQDEDLAWDPGNYSQHKRVELDPNGVWTPKVVLANSINTVQPLTSKAAVLVWNSGYILWQLSDVLHTRCKIDVQKYPFDIQKCEINFVPAYGSDIILNIKSSYLGDTDIAPKNGEWTLEGTNVKLVPAISSINLTGGQYILTLRRKRLYYGINIIFPMALLSILNPFVFLIPARSGEKLAFLMAIFVSHAMFLNLIHQSTPPTSDVISTLAMFLVMIEVQGFLTILATIVVLCVHHHKETEEKKKEKLEKARKKEVQMQKDIMIVQKNLVEVKSGWCAQVFCRRFSLERFLDGLFFVLSSCLALSGCVALWALSF